MQHLPQLALMYNKVKNEVEGDSDPDYYIREFRNQVLDFIATNPPDFGVTYLAAMDPAIRCANWLVTYDLFRLYGAEFDTAFEVVFRSSLYDHGKWIMNNLEWVEWSNWPTGFVRANHRNNHYLANIAGLIFIAAYLPRSAQVDTWMAFGYRELLREVQWQFNEDGSNFEGSTCYHAFCGDMVLWATILLSDLPIDKRKSLYSYDPGLIPLAAAKRAFINYDIELEDELCDNAIFPNWYWEKLQNICHFLIQITKPDHRLVQIGDNDSGRFLKLAPVFRKKTVKEARTEYLNLYRYNALSNEDTYWDEDTLNYDEVTERLKTLTRQRVGVQPGLVMPSWNKKRIHYSEELSSVIINQHSYFGEDQAYWYRTIESLPESQKKSLLIPASGKNLHEGLKAHMFPDFGLYLFRADNLFVRCRSGSSRGPWGHLHMDQLSIDLMLDRSNLINDPGAYTYNALSEKRNLYRSIQAHFVPFCEEIEYVLAESDMFVLSSWFPASCLAFYNNFFVGKYNHNHYEIFRMVVVEAFSLQITDFVMQSGLKLWSPECTWRNNKVIPRSVGFGKLQKVNN